MSLLLETIRFQDGLPVRLEYHLQRMKNSLAELSLSDKKISLIPQLVCPSHLLKGRVKCRVCYTESIESISFEPYIPRIISTLRCVEAPDMRYAHKFADRGSIEALSEGVKEDDILICRNGMLTDTSFANIILRKGDHFYTPAFPLLKGTQRQYLLDKGFISERIIKIEDLQEFNEIRLINAMLDPYDLLPVPAEKVYC
jgi:4-amino-4-deoxychorismate lyase